MEYFRKQGSSQRTGLQKLIETLPEIDVMVELGSAYGESADIFVQSNKIKKVICIDPWNNDREKHFDELCGKNPKIEKRKSTGNAEVKTFEDKSVDFVYIDANHSYQSVKEDIRKWLPKCRKAIGGHDYSLRFAGVVMAVAEELTGIDEKCGATNQPLVFEDNSWLVLL